MSAGAPGGERRTTGRGVDRLRVAADAEDLGRGLGRLVVALLEIVRQLLERQALRRAEGGSLTDEEVERLGQALLDLEERFAELREVFGVREGDLDLPLDIRDLDPLTEERRSR